MLHASTLFAISSVFNDSKSGFRIQPAKEGKQKLVSNQFIRTWNAQANRLGRPPVTKRVYMAMTSILSRRQQKMLREQFTYREGRL